LKVGTKATLGGEERYILVFKLLSFENVGYGTLKVVNIDSLHHLIGVGSWK